MAAPAMGQAKTQPDHDDIGEMYRFAACVIDYSRHGAETILAKDYGEEAYSDALRKLAKGHDRCVGSGELRIAGVLFAGAMAEVLLRRDHRQAELAGQLKPLDQPLAARDDVEGMALCMAFAHPAETAALLFSEPDSKESDALVGQYAQFLPGCVREGQQIRLNKLGLRAVVALAAYRIVEVEGRPPAQ